MLKRTGWLRSRRPALAALARGACISRRANAACPATSKRLERGAAGKAATTSRSSGRGQSSDAEVPATAAEGAKASPLFDLAEFMYPERHRLAGGLVLLVGSTSISLLFPRVMGAVMDSCISGDAGPGGAAYSPASAALALFGLSVLQAVFVAARAQLLNRAGESVAADMRSRTFRSLVLADSAFLDATATGELVSRLSSDTDAIRKVVTTHALAGLRSLLMIGGCAVLMLQISPPLCAVSFATFPAAMLLSRRTGRLIRDRQAAVQAALADASADAHNALLNIRTLRLFAGERRESDKYCSLVDQVRDHAVAVGAYAAVMEAGVGLALSSSLLAVLAFGGQQVLDGSLSYGDLSSFFMYTLSLGFSAGAARWCYGGLVAWSLGRSAPLPLLTLPHLPPLTLCLSGGISSAYAEVQRASGATDRLLSLLRRPPPPNGQLRLPPLQGDTVGRQIRFEGVSFAYPSRPDDPVLRDFNLTVQAGERVALVGASGSGKSTITSLLAGLYPSSAGRILIDGVDVMELDGDHLRGECVCVVPQEPVLLAGSLRHNVALGRPDAPDEDVQRAAAKAGCDFASDPGSWSREVGEQGAAMSGGQRQRVAIARMLLRDAPIIVLDEFTSALDAQTEGALLTSVSTALQGKTVLLITHRVSSLGMADRVVHLGLGGRIVKEERRTRANGSGPEAAGG